LELGEEKSMKKILSIIIIGFFISCSFGVQGVFLKQPSGETTNIGLGDIFFDLKMKVLMKLSKDSCLDH